MIELVVGGAVVGGAALVGWLMKTPTPTIAPAPPPCNKSGKILNDWAMAGASGAVAGAPAGGQGAAAGAGLALASGLADPCVSNALGAKVKAGAQAACAKADALIAEVKKKGGHIPAQYYRLSCDQKLAMATSLAASVGITAVAISAIVGAAEKAAQAAADGAKKVSEGAKSVAKKADPRNW